MAETLATCWSHPGKAIPYPNMDVSDLTLLERATAASKAGYEGIGIYLPDLRVALRTHSLEDLAQMHKDLGLKYIELEFLQGWWADGDERVESDQKRLELLAAAEVFDATHIKVGGHICRNEGEIPPALDYDLFAPALHQLGVEAAEHGTRIAIEFITTSDVASVTDAVRLIEWADHPALGLCVDNWNIERGLSTNADVAGIPAGKVFAVEVTDGLHEKRDGAFEDMINYRLLPGDGEFDIAGFVDAIRATGFTGPWGIEILSSEQRKRPVGDALSDFRTRAMPYLT